MSLSSDTVREFNTAEVGSAGASCRRRSELAQQSEREEQWKLDLYEKATFGQPTRLPELLV